jgi:alpha-beta hydrolase superfamily lysophospholipase
MQVITISSEGQQLQADLYEARNPSSRAVLICHGAFEGRQNWGSFAQRLADQGFTAVTLDFVGHGSSSGLRGTVDMAPWAYGIRDALTALGNRGYRSLALVGFGSGGSSALLAAAHDRRLECVVVMAAPVHMSPVLGESFAYLLVIAASKAYRRIRKKQLTLSRSSEFAKLRFAMDDEIDAAYKTNPEWAEMVKAVPVPESLDSVWLDITRGIEKVRVPVLILHGDQDEVIPFKQSEKLNKILRGNRKLCRIEGSGHLLHLDRKKEEVYQATVGWIKQYLK